MDKTMRHSFFLKGPKKEEHEVSETISDVVRFPSSKENYGNDEGIDTMDELEGIWRIENEGNLSKENMRGHLSWDFMSWEEEHAIGEDDQGEYKFIHESKSSCSNFFEEESNYCSKIWTKGGNLGFSDGHEKRVSLSLNLNYQEVLDAWSNRRPLWADDCSLSMASNYGCYMGEVAAMEEERSRRKASVLRYKEKRQTRLFSKKIRYQVRKLNADKRPRLKGRFVKKVSR